MSFFSLISEFLCTKAYYKMYTLHYFNTHIPKGNS